MFWESIGCFSYERPVGRSLTRTKLRTRQKSVSGSTNWSEMYSYVSIANGTASEVTALERRCQRSRDPANHIPTSKRRSTRVLVHNRSPKHLNTFPFEKFFIQQSHLRLDKISFHRLRIHSLIKKIHVSLIKICINCSNSIQLDWINKQNVAMTT